MALSQVQCLDNQHINSPRQREQAGVLLQRGPEAGAGGPRRPRAATGSLRCVLEKGIRQFLSDPELEWLSRTAEAYHPRLRASPAARRRPRAPGNLTPRVADDQLSLAVLAPTAPRLGWPSWTWAGPESISYRGITRVVCAPRSRRSTGHTHIKQVVRKTIAAATKRKIAVYIIIDQAAVPCFLAMCGRADMHRGHLKNLRVRSCGGVEFYTRMAQKVRGSLNQRFLLVDGDRAISGSYRGISLSKVSMADEPIPRPHPARRPGNPCPPRIARKLINPSMPLGYHRQPR
ncbi:hypothetical protein CRUP_008924 [Coryphaenoides rupestris]|nr:hypothetical protein CRUP_008924 [Coryphaenoides rupestris]